MVWRPTAPGEVPTLGWEVLDWIDENLAAPDRAEYEPFVPTPEQARFILGFYEINPRTGKRLIRRALLSRPRGWGKSPFLAALACAEALGPVVPDGWDADGQPVGMPWARVRTPLVDISAVSEAQTSNTWDPLLEMLRGGPAVDNHPGLEPLDTMVNLPRGNIMQITSSARSIKGRRSVFAVMDQTEEWVRSNGGLRLANRIRFNAAKVGGSSVETPNAYTAGEGSVAEASHKFAERIQGAKKAGRPYDATFLLDHRQAPETTDLDDEESLRAGLIEAYGDSADANGGWVDIDRLIAEVWDQDNDPADSRRDLLNQHGSAGNAWVTSIEWAARKADPLTVRPIAPGDLITLGFDGSRSRVKGKADATALVGCRVADGLLFTVRVWEQPDGADGEGWSVDPVQVDAEIAQTFTRFKVAGFYADPAHWETWVSQWEATYRRRLKVGRREHPIEWWMTGGRMTEIVRATRSLYQAIEMGDMWHDGSADLTRHVLNARRRATQSGVIITKATPDSPNKVDAAVAAILAWQARLDAIAKGYGRRVGSVAGRIR